MKHRLKPAALFWRNRRAVTSLEYGILAAILGLELVNAFRGFGASLQAVFTRVGNSI